MVNTWWSFNEDEINWWAPQINFDTTRFLGLVVPDWNQWNQNGFASPEYVQRVFVILPNLLKFQDSTYYRNNPLDWELDKNNMLKHLMSHEFGHSVGMNHIEDNQIMTVDVPIRSYGIIRDYKIFYDPIYTPDYSDSSRNEITTRAR